MPSKTCRVGAAVAVAMLASAPAIAWASGGHGGETTGPDPGISATAGIPGGFGTGAAASNCTWQILNNPAGPNETGRLALPPNPKVIGGQEATLYERLCGADVALVWVVPITGAAVAPGALAELQKLLPKPDPIMVPPKNDKHGFAYVQVPLWWWLPAGQWNVVSATATATNGPDTISITTTAVPHVMHFDAGDGVGAVDCAGPGVPFDDARTLAAQSTDCQYVYEHSSSLSPDGTWAASWSIVWDVAWVASDGTSGTLAPLRSTTTRALAVAEDQSVLVDPSS
jgi:hypothetical protein